MNHLPKTATFFCIFCVIAIRSVIFPDLCLCTEAAAVLKTISDEEISRLFHEANNFFTEANKAALSDPQQAKSLYEKSILRFERIIKDGGIENGKLYYNIGNIYFRIKDIGRAILNYRRAEQYIGNDLNLQKNLEYARNVRKDRIAEKQETKILKTVFFWHYDLSSKIRIVLFTLSFGLIWIFASIRIFIRKPVFRWAIGAAATLSLLFAGSLAAEYVTLRNSIPGVIISEEVIARKGNSVSYEKSFREPLHAGTEFILLENRGAWMRVELPDARTCWVQASDVELVRRNI